MSATEEQRKDAIKRVPKHPPHHAPQLASVEEDDTVTLYETGTSGWLVTTAWLRIEPAEAAIELEGEQ